MPEFEVGVAAELGLEDAEGLGMDWPRKVAKNEMAEAGWVCLPCLLCWKRKQEQDSDEQLTQRFTDFIYACKARDLIPAPSVWI